MKRFLALAAALCVLFSSAFAQEAQVETTAVQAGTASGVTIWCNHQETISDLQRSALDYPTFECSDKDFEQFLTENITQPILDMAVVDEGIMRGGFKASLDFDGILSLEASIHRLEDDAQETEVELFCALVDLNGKRMLELSELFTEPEAVVEEAICAAVYRQAEELELLVPEIDNSGLVPMPDTFFVTGDALQVLYDTHTLSVQAVSLKLPWEELPLSWSPVLTGETSISEPKAEPVIVTLEPSSTVMATVAPFPAEPVIVTMEPSSTVMATVSPFPAETLNPYFSLAPVSTPTPMPVAGNDAIMVDVLTHGLWKPLGTEGDVYYQFTADGKLLTIQVDEYSVRDGVLTSDILNGTLDIGSDSAFVLRDGNELSGYVLNRQGERVAPEEFVTPSPTPVPTPTPTPSPEPTPTPTPTPEPTPTPTPVPTATPTPTPTPVPTPTPTPTPSPWEIALATAPRMGTVEASFEKARTLKVYSAPDEEAWAAERAQVTTDHTVAIYGRESGWVLVSYAIGDGSRGRTGYIDDMTLADPSSVPLLDFFHMPLTLVRNAKATDDPLRSQSTITTLQKGSEVTLLAFFGDDWAYVETTHEEKICRLFIPASALKED